MREQERKVPSPSSPRNNVTSYIAASLCAIACVGGFAGLAAENYFMRQRSQADAAKILAATAKVSVYEQMLLGPHPARSIDDPTDLVTCPICGHESATFPGDFCEAHRSSLTNMHTAESAGGAIGNESDAQAWCNSPENVVVTPAETTDERGTLKATVKVRRALQRCGFAFIDDLYDTDHIDRWRDAYDTFKSSEQAKHFQYPCQGTGRSEVMLPFQSPFNETHIFGQPFLRGVLAGAFDGAFKMELQTVIQSSPGSGNQRWHQGWRSLFEPLERQPRPYGLIVGVVLEDLKPSMGPTEFCAGYNRRFYNGLRCPEPPVAAAMSKGGAYIFDYSLLHRGPGNRAELPRPVLMLAFSRNWFFNGGALVNRGRPLVQTVHQRRFWEQWTVHPPDPAQFFLSVQRNDESWGAEHLGHIHDQS